MVFKCCVPNCRGNYANTPRVQVFSFPQDPDLRAAWIKSIPRKDFIPTKNTRVCQAHFKDEDIRKVAEAYDDRTGKKISVPLLRFQLKKSAIPSIFPHCPSYLTTSKWPRESPDERRIRSENQALHHAIKESIMDYEAYEKSSKFSSLSNLNNLLKGKILPPPWSFIAKDDKIVFFIIECTSYPEINASAVINENLDLTAYLKQVKLRKILDFSIPCRVDDINELFTVLEHLSSPNIESSIPDKITFICELLNCELEKCDDGKEKIVKFVMEQLNLLFCSKYKYKYSSEIMIFYALLYTISPHGYRFIRSSEYVHLPHPRTIQKLCSALPTTPQNEKMDLWHLKQKLTLLKESDKKVTLMLDEIHLKPYLDYKGGNIVGMAYNSDNVATTAHVLMLQSLLSPYKEVVYILPVKNIIAEELYNFVLRTILALEKFGIFVVAVVTDNNSINRKAMTYFASPPKLQNVYCHPYNNNRPLFFIIDSVHLFKCIRNNWLNQRNAEQAFYFPDFEDQSHVDQNSRLQTASFKSLKELHNAEKSKLVKYSYN